MCVSSKSHPQATLLTENAEARNVSDMSKQSVLINTAMAIIPVVMVSLLGQLATYPNIAGWYSGLLKPAFNPPAWIFAPVWTALYILMAWAAWRVLTMPSDRLGRSTALVFFFTQLAMNAGWSWMFFGLRCPLAGLINIVPQLLVIVLTLTLFFRLDRVAGICLVPLAAWVCFATLLNFEIWRLNG